MQPEISYNSLGEVHRLAQGCHCEGPATTLSAVVLLSKRRVASQYVPIVAMLYVCLASLDYSMTYVGSQVIYEWMRLLTAAFLILRMRKAAVNNLILDFSHPSFMIIVQQCLFFAE